MKIVIDKDIPYVDEFFAPYAELVKLPGRAIAASDLRHVDGLMVRTVTNVNESLLAQSQLKFVASATSGADHLSEHYLKEHNIPCFVARGCNAAAVVEYVLATLGYCWQKDKITRSSRMAIVGVGHVGRLLAQALHQLGFECLLYDPLRPMAEPGFKSCTFADVLNANVICLHPALHTQAPFPSYHLLNAQAIAKLAPKTIIINAARGAIIDNLAILTCGQHVDWCLDVWENEPCLDERLLNQALIATPHIAGYSRESKYNATAIIFNQFAKFFNFPIPKQVTALQAFKLNTTAWQEHYQKRVNLIAENQQLKRCNAEQCQALFDVFRRKHKRL